MFNVSFIPEFYAMRTPAYSFEISSKIRDFWGDMGIVYHHSRSISYRVSENITVIVFNSPVIVHPGSLFEICQYFKIPYPKAKMDQHLKEEVDSRHKSGACLATWEKESQDDTREKRHELREAQIVRIEKAIDSLTPRIFRADNTKLETARLRAVWGSLLWELRVKRAFEAGHSFPRIFE